MWARAERNGLLFLLPLEFTELHVDLLVALLLRGTNLASVHLRREAQRARSRRKRKQLVYLLFMSILL